MSAYSRFEKSLFSSTINVTLYRRKIVTFSRISFKKITNIEVKLIIICIC